MPAHRTHRINHFEALNRALRASKICAAALANAGSLRPWQVADAMAAMPLRDRLEFAKGAGVSAPSDLTWRVACDAIRAAGATVTVRQAS